MIAFLGSIKSLIDLPHCSRLMLSKFAYFFCAILLFQSALFVAARRRDIVKHGATAVNNGIKAGYHGIRSSMYDRKLFKQNVGYKDSTNQQRSETLNKRRYHTDRAKHYGARVVQASGRTVQALANRDQTLIDRGALRQQGQEQQPQQVVPAQ
jgi:hypothetical protein